MFKKTSILLLSVAVLAACSNSPKNLEEFMVPISEFTIDNSLLKDGDFVEILGASGNLTSEHTHDFYNLIVVRSERTGDTINVLSTSFFMLNESNPRTQFISNSSTIGKMMENSSEVKESKDFDAKTLKAKKFNRVLVDTEFIQIDVRKYPAVTGVLGTIEGNSDIEDLEVLFNR